MQDIIYICEYLNKENFTYIKMCDSLYLANEQLFLLCSLANNVEIKNSIIFTTGPLTLAKNACNVRFFYNCIYSRRNLLDILNLKELIIVYD